MRPWYVITATPRTRALHAVIMVAVAASSSCLWALVAWEAVVAASVAVALAAEASVAEALVAVAAAHAGNQCVIER